MDLKDSLRFVRKFVCRDCGGKASVYQGRVRVYHDEKVCPTGKSLHRRFPGLYRAA